MRHTKSLLVLIAACVCGLGAAPNDKSLHVYYSFNDGDTQNKPHGSILDRGPGKHNGTLYGARYTPMGDGHALAIENRKAYARCGDARQMLFDTGNYTIATWMKLDQFSPGMIIAKKGPEADSPGFHLSYDQADKQLTFNVSNGKQDDSLAAPLHDQQWHHVVVVRRGRTIALHIDGEEIVSQSSPVFGSKASAFQVVLFLGRAVGPTNSFIGKLDDVYIYKRALTEAQIASGYRSALQSKPMSDEQRQLKAAGGLVLHYKFDADHGDVAKDHSPFGNDGKNVNGQHMAEAEGRHGVMRFNGKDAWIECGNNDWLRMNGDMTFEMRVRLNGEMTRWATIFGENPLYNFLFQVAGYQSLVLYLRAERPPYGVEAYALPVDHDMLSSKWSHVAVVVEYPRCRFYLNGELINDAYMPVDGVWKGRNTMKYLGGRKGACTPMDVDEFRLYRRALTAGEVKAHANDNDAPVTQNIELAVEPHWYDKIVTLRLSCKGVNFAGHTAKLAIGSGSKTVALTETGEGSGRFVASAQFPLKPLQGKQLRAAAYITDAAGKKADAVNVQADLKKPDWVHSRAGYFDGVLPPWTPVKTKKRSGGRIDVDVWDRTYTFGATPIIDQIEAGGEKLLASPVTLDGRADGKAIAWGKPRVTLNTSSKTAAALKHKRDSGNISLNIDTTLEYDGYAIFDCTVTAKRDVTLEQLTLDIPMQRRHATLGIGFQTLPPVTKPKIPMAEYFGGAIDKDLSFRFGGSVWLGDEERGLSWQAETDKDWHYADRDQAMQVLPRDNVTTFRQHWINVPTKLKAGETLHYKFSLQGTPIRPMVRDAWDLRVVRSEPYGKDLDLPTRKTPSGKPSLQAYADAGIRHLFVNINDIWPWPMPVHDEFKVALHKMFKAVHDHGLTAHDYMIHQRVPVNVPEFDIHGAHMAKQPMRWYVQNGPKAKGDPRPGPLTVDYGANSQGSILHCPRSMALQDAYIHSLARRVDEFGDDGIYLDGTSHAPGCQNMAHGCGYMKEDGTMRNTFPVFAARQFMKRIYTVIKTRKPDGVVDLHTSFSLLPAQTAYSDVYWTGEHWWHLKHTGAKHIPDELKLAHFRAEFMGTQFGVAANTLAYRLGAKIKVAAIALLHDVPVRPNNIDRDVLTHQPTKLSFSHIMSKLWKARDRFDAKAARKLFYWQNQDYVTVAGERCYSTLLHNPKTGVWAYVTNLSTEPQQVTVKLNLSKLGLAGKTLEAFDVLTEKSIPIADDGTFTVPQESMQWQYVWVRPSK